MAISRRSVKREAMLSLLRSTNVHPTAEWVFSRLRSEFPELSLGTVYRNLRQLEEEGLIVSVGVIDGQEHFDGCVAPHGHFVCRRCGAVKDLDVACSDDLTREAEGRTGGRAERVEVRVSGVCRECLDRDMRA